MTWSNTIEQQLVVNAIKARGARTTAAQVAAHPRRLGRSNEEYVRLGTAAAHAVEREGITIADAAKRFDISYHSAWSHHRRLYPAATERRWL